MSSDHGPAPQGPTAPYPKAPAEGRVRRATQSRSRATHDKLLAAGRELLATHDFESLSIADLTAACQASVGSFYGRFRDKEAFFAVLQDQIAQEWLGLADDALSSPSAAASPAATVRAFAQVVLRMFRRDAGFFRAALRHASTHPDTWTPIKQAGRELAARFEAALDAHEARPASTDHRRRVRFAVQVAYGTCINAVLNDPGPLKLADSRLDRELARLICLYLGIPAD